MLGQRQPGNQPHHHKTWECRSRGGKVPGASSPCCCPPGRPFPSSLLLCQHVWAPSRALERVPLPATIIGTVSNLLTYHWELESWTKQETVLRPWTAGSVGVPGLGSSREGEHTHQPDDYAPLCLQVVFTLQLQAEEPMNILAESELRTRVSW